jgi:hypothetical protein
VCFIKYSSAVDQEMNLKCIIVAKMLSWYVAPKKNLECDVDINCHCLGYENFRTGNGVVSKIMV